MSNYFPRPEEIENPDGTSNPLSYGEGIKISAKQFEHILKDTETNAHSHRTRGPFLWHRRRTVASIRATLESYHRNSPKGTPRPRILNKKSTFGRPFRLGKEADKQKGWLSPREPSTLERTEDPEPKRTLILETTTEDKDYSDNENLEENSSRPNIRTKDDKEKQSERIQFLIYPATIHGEGDAIEPGKETERPWLSFEGSRLILNMKKAVSGLEDITEGEVEAIIDTGATTSVIREDLIPEELRREIGDSVTALTLTGDTIEMKQYIMLNVLGVDIVFLLFPELTKDAYLGEPWASKLVKQTHRDRHHSGDGNIDKENNPFDLSSVPPLPEDFWSQKSAKIQGRKFRVFKRDDSDAKIPREWYTGGRAISNIKRDLNEICYFLTVAKVPDSLLFKSSALEAKLGKNDQSYPFLDTENRFQIRFTGTISVNEKRARVGFTASGDEEKGNSRICTSFIQHMGEVPKTSRKINLLGNTIWVKEATDIDELVLLSPSLILDLLQKQMTPTDNPTTIPSWLKTGCQTLFAIPRDKELIAKRIKETESQEEFTALCFAFTTQSLEDGGALDLRKLVTMFPQDTNYKRSPEKGHNTRREIIDEVTSTHRVDRTTRQKTNWIWKEDGHTLVSSHLFFPQLPRQGIRIGRDESSRLPEKLLQNDRVCRQITPNDQLKNQEENAGEDRRFEITFLHETIETKLAAYEGTIPLSWKFLRSIITRLMLNPEQQWRKGPQIPRWVFYSETGLIPQDEETMIGNRQTRQIPRTMNNHRGIMESNAGRDTGATSSSVSSNRETQRCSFTNDKETDPTQKGVDLTYPLTPSSDDIADCLTEPRPLSRRSPFSKLPISRQPKLDNLVRTDPPTLYKKLSEFIRECLRIAKGERPEVRERQIVEYLPHAFRDPVDVTAILVWYKKNTDSGKKFRYPSLAYIVTNLLAQTGFTASEYLLGPLPEPDEGERPHTYFIARKAELTPLFDIISESTPLMRRAKTNRIHEAIRNYFPPWEWYTYDLLNKIRPGDDKDPHYFLLKLVMNTKDYRDMRFSSRKKLFVMAHPRPKGPARQPQLTDVRTPFPNMFQPGTQPRLDNENDPEWLSRGAETTRNLLDPTNRKPPHEVLGLYLHDILPQIFKKAAIGVVCPNVTMSILSKHHLQEHILEQGRLREPKEPEKTIEIDGFTYEVEGILELRLESGILKTAKVVQGLHWSVIGQPWATRVLFDGREIEDFPILPSKMIPKLSIRETPQGERVTVGDATQSPTKINRDTERQGTENPEEYSHNSDTRRSRPSRGIPQTLRRDFVSDPSLSHSSEESEESRADDSGESDEPDAEPFDLDACKVWPGIFKPGTIARIDTGADNSFVPENLCADGILGHIDYYMGSVTVSSASHHTIETKGTSVLLLDNEPLAVHRIDNPNLGFVVIGQPEATMILRGELRVRECEKIPKKAINLREILSNKSDPSNKIILAVAETTAKSCEDSSTREITKIETATHDPDCDEEPPKLEAVSNENRSKQADTVDSPDTTSTEPMNTFEEDGEPQVTTEAAEPTSEEIAESTVPETNLTEKDDDEPTRNKSLTPPSDDGPSAEPPNTEMPAIEAIGQAKTIAVSEHETREESDEGDIDNNESVPEGGHETDVDDANSRDPKLPEEILEVNMRLPEGERSATQPNGRRIYRNPMPKRKPGYTPQIEDHRYLIITDDEGYKYGLEDMTPSPFNVCYTDGDKKMVDHYVKKGYRLMDSLEVAEKIKRDNDDKEAKSAATLAKRAANKAEREALKAEEKEKSDEEFSTPKAIRPDEKYIEDTFGRKRKNLKKVFETPCMDGAFMSKESTAEEYLATLKETIAEIFCIKHPKKPKRRTGKRARDYLGQQDIQQHMSEKLSRAQHAINILLTTKGEERPYEDMPIDDYETIFEFATEETQIKLYDLKEACVTHIDEIDEAPEGFDRHRAKSVNAAGQELTSPETEYLKDLIKGPTLPDEEEEIAKLVIRHQDEALIIAQVGKDGPFWAGWRWSKGPLEGPKALGPESYPSKLSKEDTDKLYEKIAEFTKTNVAIPNNEPPTVRTPWFGVVQPSGEKGQFKVRPVHDLRNQNMAIRNTPMLQDTIEGLLRFLLVCIQIIKIDLSAAFHSIRILPAFRKYLGFSFRKKEFVFRRTPFGIIWAPKALELCMRLKLHPFFPQWRLCGWSWKGYMDDLFGGKVNQIASWKENEEETKRRQGKTDYDEIPQQEEKDTAITTTTRKTEGEGTWSHNKMMLEIQERLAESDFTIQNVKCALITAVEAEIVSDILPECPDQGTLLLGCIFDYKHGRVYYQAAEKLDKAELEKKVTKTTVFSICGRLFDPLKINPASGAVASHLRSLVGKVICSWKAEIDDQWKHALGRLIDMAKQENNQIKAPLKIYGEAFLFTDSSLTGWGYVLYYQEPGGKTAHFLTGGYAPWKNAELRQHISLLELRAAAKALSIGTEAMKHLEVQRLYHLIDNKTSFDQIRSGRTRTDNRLAARCLANLLDIANEWGGKYRARWIDTTRNESDRGSRVLSLCDYVVYGKWPAKETKKDIADYIPKLEIDIPYSEEETEAHDPFAEEDAIARKIEEESTKALFDCDDSIIGDTTAILRAMEDQINKASGKHPFYLNIVNLAIQSGTNVAHRRKIATYGCEEPLPYDIFDKEFDPETEYKRVTIFTVPRESYLDNLTREEEDKPLVDPYQVIVAEIDMHSWACSKVTDGTTTRSEMTASISELEIVDPQENDLARAIGLTLENVISTMGQDRELLETWQAISRARERATIPAAYRRFSPQLGSEGNILRRRYTPRLHSDEKSVIVVPLPMRRELIDKLHRRFHDGSATTYDQACELMWWPMMEHDVSDLVANCETCKKAKITRRVALPDYMGNPFKEAKEAYHTVCLDTVELHIAANTKVILLTAQDVFSKYIWAIPLKDKSARNMLKAFDTLLSLMDKTPKRVWHDNGSEFLNRETLLYWQNKKVEQATSPVYRPQANGVVERWHRSLREKMRAQRISNRRDWRESLNVVLNSYNTTRHSVTGLPPTQLIVTKKPDLLSKAREAIDKAHKNRSDKANADRSHGISDLKYGDIVLQKTQGNDRPMGKDANVYDNSSAAMITEVINNYLVKVQPLDRNTGEKIMNTRDLIRVEHIEDPPPFCVPGDDDPQVRPSLTRLGSKTILKESREEQTHIQEVIDPNNEDNLYDKELRGEEVNRDSQPLEDPLTPRPPTVIPKRTQRFPSDESDAPVIAFPEYSSGGSGKDNCCGKRQQERSRQHGYSNQNSRSRGIERQGERSTKPRPDVRNTVQPKQRKPTGGRGDRSDSESDKGRPRPRHMDTVRYSESESDESVHDPSNDPDEGQNGTTKPIRGGLYGELMKKNQPRAKAPPANTPSRKIGLLETLRQGKQAPKEPSSRRGGDISELRKQLVQRGDGQGYVMRRQDDKKDKLIVERDDGLDKKKILNKIGKVFFNSITKTRRFVRNQRRELRDSLLEGKLEISRESWLILEESPDEAGLQAVIDNEPGMKAKLEMIFRDRSNEPPNPQDLPENKTNSPPQQDWKNTRRKTLGLPLDEPSKGTYDNNDKVAFSKPCQFCGQNDHRGNRCSLLANHEEKYFDANIFASENEERPPHNDERAMTPEQFYDPGETMEDEINFLQAKIDSLMEEVSRKEVEIENLTERATRNAKTMETAQKMRQQDLRTIDAQRGEIDEGKNKNLELSRRLSNTIMENQGLKSQLNEAAAKLADLQSESMNATNEAIYQTKEANRFSKELIVASNDIENLKEQLWKSEALRRTSVEAYQRIVTRKNAEEFPHLPFPNEATDFMAAQGMERPGAWKSPISDLSASETPGDHQHGPHQQTGMQKPNLDHNATDQFPGEDINEDLEEGYFSGEEVDLLNDEFEFAEHFRADRPIADPRSNMREDLHKHPHELTETGAQEGTKNPFAERTNNHNFSPKSIELMGDQIVKERNNGKPNLPTPRPMEKGRTRPISSSENNLPQRPGRNLRSRSLGSPRQRKPKHDSGKAKLAPVIANNGTTLADLIQHGEFERHWTGSPTPRQTFDDQDMPERDETEELNPDKYGEDKIPVIDLTSQDSPASVEQKPVITENDEENDQIEQPNSDPCRESEVDLADGTTPRSSKKTTRRNSRITAGIDLNNIISEGRRRK